MTLKLVFPSLMHSDRAHIVTCAMDLWDQAYRAHMPLDSRCGWYPTYGDGMVQHGHTCVVCEQDFLVRLRCSYAGAPTTQPDTTSRLVKSPFLKCLISTIRLLGVWR